MNIFVHFQTIFLTTLLQSGGLSTLPENQMQALKIAADSTLKVYLLEAEYEKKGLINVHTILSQSHIDIRYSYPDNFLNKDVYGDYCACHLQKDAIVLLEKAHQYLQEIKSGWTFVFYDCTRPVSVQQKMWDALSHLPPAQRGKYVSNPRNHSVHNYGLAIDLGLVNELGEVVDMGTDFDYFGELAYPSAEDRLLKTGKLNTHQVENRRLLRKVMLDAGFRQQAFEWWHYNTYPRSVAKQLYEPVY